MQKISVYPFDKDFLDVYRIKKDNDFLYKYFVSPAGWGYNGLDIGRIDEGEPLGFLVSSNFESAIDDSDTLLLAQHSKWLERYKILERVDYAIEKGKNIICLFELTKNEYEIIQEKSKEKNIEFIYLCNNFDAMPASDQDTIDLGLRKINTPVVVVFGLLENSNKFSTQLNFFNFTSSQGYKVSLIGSRSYGNFVGVHSIPTFLYSQEIKDYEKIILFNHFVKQIELNDNPDLIIIGIPGALFPLSRKFHNHFGILGYHITRAVEPDAAILCAYVENYNNEYLTQLMSLCQHRFSSDITGILIDNITVEFHGQGIPENISFMHVAPTVAEKAIQQFEPIIPIFTSAKQDELFEMVLGQLSHNSDYESM